MAEHIQSNINMTPVQIAFCVGYCALALLLIAVIAAQQGQNRNPAGSLSGSVSDSYYAKNIGKSKEAKKKKLTIALSVLFFGMTVGASYLFI